MRTERLTVSLDVFKERRAQKDYFLLDIREPWEVDIASLKEATNIPLSELDQRVNELPQDRDIIVLCHHGIRSLQTAEWLNELGYHASSLEGGIHMWAEKIDPTVAQY